MRSSARLAIALALLSPLSPGCQTERIQDARTCAVAGDLSAGMDCSHLTKPGTDSLSFGESIEFLDAQPARRCVPSPIPGVCAEDQSHGAPLDLPARGAAICTSSADMGAILVEIATMCRYLGSRCSYEQRVMIERLAERVR